MLLVTVVSLGLTVAYADEIIVVSLDLQTLLLDSDEVIPLLNTNNIENMSKVTVSATLPCTSSNIPSLKITGGILGNTTNIIESSGDYVNLRGPFDTCLFEDTLDVSNSTIPALNRIFLTNDGTSSVLTNLGTTVTITGVVPQNQTLESVVPFDPIPLVFYEFSNLNGVVNQATISNYLPSVAFSDDFNTDEWVDSSTNPAVDATINNRLDFDVNDTTIQQSTVNDRTSISDKFVLRAKLDLTTLTNNTDATAQHAFIGVSDSDQTVQAITAQNAVMLGTRTVNNSVDFELHHAAQQQFVGGATDSILSGITPSNGTVYVEITALSAKTAQATIYSDSDFTNVLGTTAVAATTDFTGLRYLKASVYENDSTPTGRITGSFDDVKLYDNFATLGASADGTNNGATTGTPGIRDEAYNFDGLDDHVNIDPLATIGNATGGTISVWWNNDDDSNLGNIFTCNDNGDASSYFQIRTETDGNLRVHILDTGTKTLDFDIASTDINSEGLWNHLVLIVDSSGNRSIVNGNVITPTYGTGSASTSSWLNDVANIDVCSLGVNRNNVGFANYFDGSIDDFAYFNTGLSTSEAQQLYNNGNSLDLSE